MHEETTKNESKQKISVEDLFLKDEVFQIIGAAIEVHRVLGPGFLEAVYQEAMEIELAARGIPFEPQKLLPIMYKGKKLAKDYQADLLCYSEILVELKAQEKLVSRDEAQLLNYIKAGNNRLGLLINFGSVGKLEWKRMIY